MLNLEKIAARIRYKCLKNVDFSIFDWFSIGFNFSIVFFYSSYLLVFVS